MSRPTLLQKRFTRMVRDFPRTDMPKDTAWDLVDWIPEHGAPLRRRGGYTYFSDDISATTATASWVAGGIQAPFNSGGQQHLVVDEDGRLYKINASTGGVTDIGQAGLIRQNPVFHNQLVIITDTPNAQPPDKYNGSTIAVLGGSPPNARFCEVWRDYTVLGNTASGPIPNRIWFSGLGNPESWNTTTGYWDFVREVTGLAALQGIILVFHDDAVSRLRGTIAPPGGDLSADDPFFDEGCPDATGIAKYRDRIIWMNGNGIWWSDGITVDDLTARCGVKRYWRDLMEDFVWTIAGTNDKLVCGVYQDFLVWSVYSLGGGAQDAGCIDLKDFRFFRFDNLTAGSMWKGPISPLTNRDLYMGTRLESPRVVSLSSMFRDDLTGIEDDADGDPVSPVLETAFYEGDYGEKTWKNLYIVGDLRENSSAPTMNGSYFLSPELTTPSANLSNPVFSQTTARTRERIPINVASSGMAFKIVVNLISNADARLYELHADVYERERSRG